MISLFSCFWQFWPTKWPQNSILTWSAQHNLGAPKYFTFMNFFIWALFLPQKKLLKNIFPLKLFQAIKTLSNEKNFVKSHSRPFEQVFKNLAQ